MQNPISIGLPDCGRFLTSGVHMGRVFVCALFVLLLVPLAAMAQPDYPAAEVFGGYSYFRANPEGFNLNGWNASLTGNITDWFGIEGDFSGHYSHALDEFGHTIHGINIDQYTFMAGPRLAYRAGSITPFAHFLIGSARAGTRYAGDGSISDWVLATVIGGGVDINLSKSVAVRAAQADYLMTRFNIGHHEDRQNNFRFSAGIVLKLGSR
jgi:opacity protein-like surface antigen